MSPRKRTKGGTYTLDTHIIGVGRICFATGARTVAEYRKRVALVNKLRDTGRLDILRAIKDGSLHINEVYAANLSGDVGFVLLDLVARRGLWEAVNAWLPVSARSASTRARYKGAFVVVRRVTALGAAATISNLKSVDWERLYIGWTQSAAHWNHMRRAISRFLSSTFGKHSQFRLELLARFPNAAEQARITDLSVDDFYAVLAKMPDVYHPAFITLAATGMRVRSEFLRCNDMNLRNESVHIPGTKTAGSDRISPVASTLWPWVRDAIPCPFSYDQLRRVWIKASADANVAHSRLNDLRHCFGQWLTNAGRPMPSVQASMGHEHISTTARYTRTMMKSEDADAMGRILAGISEPVITPVVDVDAKGFL